MEAGDTKKETKLQRGRAYRKSEDSEWRDKYSKQAAAWNLSLAGLGEVYFDPLAVVVRDSEEFAPLQVHETGHEDFRNLADACVVGIHIVVEKLAAVRDALF